MADKIRHLHRKRAADGGTAFFWTPSPTLRKLGIVGEALGRDEITAFAKALQLNEWVDSMRRAPDGEPHPKPGSVALLFRQYKQSDEFNGIPGVPELPGLKPRTRHDYAYYIEKIEAEFGDLPVRAITPRVVKAYYRRLCHERGITWAYHVMGTLRAVLSWAVSEDWIKQNPALDVTVHSPPKRNVIWNADQAAAYIAKAEELGWESIATMARVFDCIGQSPIDVRTLRMKSYNGSTISVTRTKSGVHVSPVPLWPETKQALDKYIASRPSLLPDAFIFVNDRLNKPWIESTLAKAHNEIRVAAALPKNLQLQDFRRTAQTEAGAAGGTVDEIRALAQHSTRKAGEYYVRPDERYAKSVQQKRLAIRNEKRAKVGMRSGEKSE